MTAPLASRLLGKTVGNWQVLEKRAKTEEDHSGAFSSCYLVKNITTGNIGFLKAFNYLYAFCATGGGRQPADILKELTLDYTYERDLLLFCKAQRMDRIVTAIDHGEYKADGESVTVPYLVFEAADGSLKNIKALKNPGLGWKLRSFHNCLVGLEQLHNRKIAHQDIKPSNILVFGETVSKLSDLGNATQFENESRRWHNPGFCGDIRFAPIELFYGHFSTNWETRRFGADFFMMGGIITYLVTDFNFLELMMANLPSPYHYTVSGITFEQALPHLIDAFNKALKQIEAAIPEKIRRDLIEVIAQLCYPIPEERGMLKNIYTSLPQYSLHRYISIIDRLTKNIESEKYQ
jgi:serine/threonine protein kinase